MPRFTIRDIIIDDRNIRHATARATEQQLRSVLTGTIEARPNRKNRTADYIYTGTASDGTRWTIPFDYYPDTQSARPITAIPA